MIKLYSFLFFIFISINLSFCQTNNYPFFDEYDKMDNYIFEDAILNKNEISEVLDSMVIFMRVDTQYLISNEVFWDTMFYFYYENDEKNNAIKSNYYSLINTYDSGERELWNSATYFYNNNNKLEKTIELRKNYEAFDTLTFLYYYTNFFELDSITLNVQFEGDSYHVRTDKYYYDNKYRQQRIKRFVLDDNNSFVLGIEWLYFYSSPDIERFSLELMNEYYNGEIINSQKDSFFINEYLQLDSVHQYYLDDNNSWVYGSSEDWFYSESYQIYPDSFRMYNIIDGVKDFEAVQTLFKHTVEVGTDELDIEYCNCIIPNPYSYGQIIKCLDVRNNAEFKNSSVMVYDVLGSLVFQDKATENIRLPGLEKERFHIFTIRSKSGKILFSKSFISSDN